jgi:hypothetical protein
MTANEIARLLAANAEAVCKHLLRNGKEFQGKWRCGNVYGDAGKSLQVQLKGDKAGVWHDWDSKQSGDMIGLWMAHTGESIFDACESAMEWLNIPDDQRGKSAPPTSQPKPTERPEVREPSKTWLRIQAEMKPGTVTQLSTLADLRKIPALAGLQLATNHGQLFFADIHDAGWDYEAWIITDSSRRNAQARRCDGKLWESIDAKAKTIAGCEAKWPVGVANVHDGHNILLVEGGPDFLAAWHLIWENELTKTHRPVAMFGAANPIHTEALPLFAGRCVQILPHRDDNLAGAKAAARWRDTLLPIAAHVTISQLPTKDLNDLVTAEAATGGEE